MSDVDSHSNHKEQSLPNNALMLITLSELKALGEFARYQDIQGLLTNSVGNLTLGYPLFTTRLKANRYIDLLLNEKWVLVEFLSMDNSYIYYRQNSRKEKIALDDPWAKDRRVAKYCIAPAGLYTSYDRKMPTINTVKLSDAYERSSNSYATGCEVHKVSAPYVTLRIEFADKYGSSGWDFATFHIADPRICVDGVVSHTPYYNSPIAVSHRWLGKTHPDPGGVHFRELMNLCEKMEVLDCQTFFIDYCSLPQAPRSPEDDALFRRELPKCNRYYQKSALILIEETDDYETRAWCMLEMLLSSVRDAILNKEMVEGKLTAAFDLARSYVDVSIQNFEAMKAFGLMPGGTVSPSQFSKWASGSQGLNLVFYQLKQRNKESILNWFKDHNLKSTSMEDIPIIMELLDELL